MKIIENERMDKIYRSASARDQDKEREKDRAKRENGARNGAQDEEGAGEPRQADQPATAGPRFTEDTGEQTEPR